MSSLRRYLRYFGRRYVPSTYAAYLRWRNTGVPQGHEEWQDWDKRTALVRACPDNERIPRVPSAGVVSNGWQIMHNGLQVIVDGYYGAGVTRMLELNHGSHEPQEELVFDAVTARMPPRATIIECGAYWGFYSLCFCKSVPDAAAYLIEPDLYNLSSGRRNFARNGFEGRFTNAYVGATPGRASDGADIVAIDDFAARSEIMSIDMLHADIQGAEVEMLHGSKKVLSEQRVRYLFISTHHHDLHQECLRLLEQQYYQIVCSVDLAESFSFDGFLVAARPGEQIDGLPMPCKRSPLPQEAPQTGAA